jgi:uncharacterized protein YdeI (YjbR/CyaY-like superfamily)
VTDTGARQDGGVDARYFESAAAFRDWLEEHHATETEVLVGFWKAATGRPSLTWSESVDEALCHGWIDGVRRRVDDERFTIRFTPRKPRSNWSLVNVRKVAELTAAGRMRPAGLAAFEARRERDTGVYSFERAAPAELDEAATARFREQPRAWEWFEAQAPSYRRAALHWVTSAKRAETRERRLTQLVADSAAGQRIAPMRVYGRERKA